MSGKGNMISDSAWRKIVEIFKWYERVKHQTKPQQRRRQIISAGGGLATVWAIVTEIPEYNDPTKDRYVVQKASVVTGTWTGDGTDITIERALGYEGYDANAEDIRNWAPWYLVGSLVEIVSRWDEGEAAAQWYIDMPMMYGGEESVSSFRHSEEDGIVQAVWA